MNRLCRYRLQLSQCSIQHYHYNIVLMSTLINTLFSVLLKQQTGEGRQLLLLFNYSLFTINRNKYYAAKYTA